MWFGSNLHDELADIVVNELLALDFFSLFIASMLSWKYHIFHFIGFPVKAIISSSCRSPSSYQRLDLIRNWIWWSISSQAWRRLVTALSISTCVELLFLLWLLTPYICAWVSLLYFKCFRFHWERTGAAYRWRGHRDWSQAQSPSCGNCNNRTSGYSDVMVWCSADGTALTLIASLSQVVMF